MESTPRSRFSSTLGHVPPLMGTPARRAPATPLSARKTLGRSTRAPSNYQFSIHNTPNNIFRSSMSSLSADRSRPNGFQPRASSALRQTFSPGPTPQSTRAFRASTSTVNGGGMGKTGATHLFDMTIDEPSADLDGEELMKHVPQDPNRQGSVYADEFLAHLCPPGLDDEGRRQWFCIMDLRRLKYAANELFAKKDWKINVTNFAKEYEKSRSLILLRYQLFEFKTVKPTDEMLRKWRASNGIADPEDDAQAKRSQVNGSKRKADDDLPLADSTANKNKRRQVEPDEEQAPAKNKRRAAGDDEGDENKPSKLQKSAPSQTKSLFQRLAKSTASAPSFQASISPAGAGGPLIRAKLTAGTASKSVFEDPKASSQDSTGNIFEHLSDVSRSASVNNGEDDVESDTDSEADEDSEGKASEASVVASGGVATPAEGQGSTPGRSLFDRITKDINGQPIRVLDSIEDKPASFAPVNKTWNPDTPIKFGSSPSSSILSSKPQEPPAPAPFKPMFTKKSETPAPASVPTPSPKLSLFGTATKDAEIKPEMESTPESTSTATSAPSDPSSKPAEPATKPAPTNMFGATTTPNTSGLLAGSVQAKSTTPAAPFNGVMQSSTLFGSSKPVEESTKTPLFGAVKPVEASPAINGDSEAPKPILFGATSTNKPQSLFGAPAAPAEEKPKQLFGAASTDDKPKTPLFGSVAPEDKPNGSVFGTLVSSDDKPKTSLFAAGSTPSTSGTLFGGPSTTTASAFGTQDNKATEPTAAKPLFGSFGSATSITPAASSTLFGASKETPKDTPIFGVPEKKPDVSTSTPLFGASKETPKETPIFGASEKKVDASTSNTLFGVSKPVQSSNIFGGSQTTAGTSNIFGGSSSAAPPTNIFGGSSNGPSSNLFGASQNSASATPALQAPSLFGANQGTVNNSSGSFSFIAPGVSNPFAGASVASAAPSSGFFGMSNNNNGESNSSAGTFVFGGASSSNATPGQSQGGMFNFGSGGRSGTATPPPSGPSISFTGATPMSANPNAGNLFAPNFAGGASTGTSSPFNFGGASSLATTPATGTPEPTTAATSAAEEKSSSNNKKSDSAAGAADDDGAEKHEQINLTEGGPGEEDEEVLYEVRCKAMKEEKVVPKDGEEEKKGGEEEKPKSAWSIKGLGPLRILKHKTTGSVRILLRGEPRGHVVINALPLPTMEYMPKGKYVVAAFANDKGGLDKWMLMVKTPEAAKALADKIQDVKKENKAS